MNQERALSDEVSRPRDGRAVVWAESPLQLLSAIEAHGAGLLGKETVIHPRGNAVGLNSTLQGLRVQLPDGVTFAAPSSVVPSPRNSSVDSWVSGDAYSGKAQAQMLGGIRTGEMVIVDDGLATLKMLSTLVRNRPAPLVRPRVASSASRRALGLATWFTLRRLAHRGRLLVFTALPVPPDVDQKFRALGGKLERHCFEWLGSQPITESIQEPTIMVGSAMPADGLIHWEPYLQWVHSLTEDGPVGYFPHRRETPESLHRLGQHPLVHVHQHTLPVEIRLRGLRSTQTVHALPSTVLSSLRLVLAPSGVRVKGHCVQEDWWTTSTGLAVRRDLSSSLEEERFIR